MSEHPSARSILESNAQIEELYEVKTFTGNRKGKRVIVRLLDLGPECQNPAMRFACEVEQEDGKKARGNNAPTPDVAVDIVHWTELD